MLAIVSVQMRNNAADDTVSNTTETNSRPVESNYLEPAPVTVRQRISSSGGPLSPSSPSPPPPLPTMNTNNNCEFKCVYTNFPLTPTSTINFDNLRYLLALSYLLVLSDPRGCQTA